MNRFVTNSCFVLAMSAVSANAAETYSGTFVHYEGAEYESTFIPRGLDEVWKVTGGPNQEILIARASATESREIFVSLVLNVTPIDKAAYPHSHYSGTARIVRIIEADEIVNGFALEVRSLIADSDDSGFSQLHCLPEPCVISDTALERIFGPTNVATDFERIMRHKDLDIWINGPYTRETRWPKSTYTVIYYDPANAPFDSSGYVPTKIGEENLYKSFLQMEVTIIEGTVYFHRVPFHLGAHHPYAGDYG